MWQKEAKMHQLSKRWSFKWQLFNCQRVFFSENGAANEEEKIYNDTFEVESAVIANANNGTSALINTVDSSSENNLNEKKRDRNDSRSSISPEHKKANENLSDDSVLSSSSSANSSPGLNVTEAEKLLENMVEQNMVDDVENSC